MKLSEIRKLSHSIPLSELNQDPAKLQEYLLHLGIDTHNFYQELEMESRLVDTHQDISYSNTNFHSHAFYELICCRNTCGTEYLVGTERYKLQKGDIVIVPPGISHRPLLPAQIHEPYIRDILWISEEFMQLIFPMLTDTSHQDLAKPSLFRTAGTHWESICELFRNGVREAEAAELNWELSVIANTLTILTQLSRARADLAARPMKAEKPELLDEVLGYVELHLAEKLSLADIARQFFVSESTITQTFRKKMGVSFYRCVIQRRLIAAKAHIEKNIPLEHVAEQVGFTDYSSFFRAFKQEYGISPRQYRKMHFSGETKERTPL